ncbi:siphovirus Gp157 family protein [Halarcobacter bivalviorum]|uniref:siphovirus Gp157 family protein n=1 Tax=Halarcobacter bivalviorum TaxID=663364 RepID=UPI00100B3C9C|nr:siphovirus Gp157 family protein [Halarcobacter bivalviorum]RXK03336.1 hypothetical protein CRU97_12495 [Halarcobacter bivalviorum]
MKLVNYALQKQIETLGEHKSQEFFKNYIQQILEDDSKPYYQKADYVGLSLNELKNKIDYLSSNIKELQALKKKLSESLELAKVLTAQVLVSNGVNRVDGNIISSLTLTKESTTIKKKITITDENAVMGLGFVKFSVDEEAIEKALEEESSKDLKELNKYIKIEDIKAITEAKVKVNTKRAVNNAETTTDEILQLKQAS